MKSKISLTFRDAYTALATMQWAINNFTIDLNKDYSLVSLQLYQNLILYDVLVAPNGLRLLHLLEHDTLRKYAHAIYRNFFVVKKLKFH